MGGRSFSSPFPSFSLFSSFFHPFVSCFSSPFFFTFFLILSLLPCLFVFYSFLFFILSSLFSSLLFSTRSFFIFQHAFFPQHAVFCSYSLPLPSSSLNLPSHLASLNSPQKTCVQRSSSSSPPSAVLLAPFDGKLQRCKAATIITFGFNFTGNGRTGRTRLSLFKHQIPQRIRRCC